MSKRNLATGEQAEVVSLADAGRTTTVVSIPNGTSVSASLDLATTALIGFIAPAAWTVAALNIEASIDGTTWVTAGLFNQAGTAVSSWSSVTAGAGYSVDSAAMLPWRYIRFRSGTAAAPVTQLAQRDFTAITRFLA